MDQEEVTRSTSKLTSLTSDTNFSLCFICQRETEAGLVEKPMAHENVLKHT